MAQQSVSKDVMKLLLMGRTGVGKSATGNSILGKKAFKVSGGGKSVTLTMETGFSEIEGCSLKVFDVLGLENTAHSEAENIAIFVSNVQKTLSECNGSINALVLVIKYGDQCSLEMQSCIDTITNVLGKGILGESGIVVMTNANCWYMENSEDTKFRTWCETMNTNYGGIFERCRYRCALFENTTRNETEMKKQRGELLKLASETRPYTKENFQNADAERFTFAARKKYLVMKKDYQEKYSLVTAEIKIISKSLNAAEKMRAYEGIKQRAGDLLRQVREDDAGSGMLAELQQQLEWTIADLPTDVTE